MHRPASPAGLPELRERIAALCESLARTARDGQLVVIVRRSRRSTCARASFWIRAISRSWRARLSGRAGRVRAFGSAGASRARRRGRGAHRGSSTRLRRPHALYLTPSQQFPVGRHHEPRASPAGARVEHGHAGFLIGDDCDREFWYDGRPLAALHGLDRHERVIYLGTFNKALFPGLRLAYLSSCLRGSPEAFAAAGVADSFSPVLPQIVLADFAAGGHFARLPAAGAGTLPGLRRPGERRQRALGPRGRSRGLRPRGFAVAAHGPCGRRSRGHRRLRSSPGASVSALSAHATVKHPARADCCTVNFAADPTSVHSIHAMAPVVRPGRSGSLRAGREPPAEGRRPSYHR